MRMRSRGWCDAKWRLRARGLAGLMSLSLTVIASGCKTKSPTKAWVDDDTAYMRCEAVGAPLSLEVQRPRPPSLSFPDGFYVGDMEPASLAKVGFARDSVVCATLQAPSTEQLTESKRQLYRLAQERKALQELLDAPTPCACEALYRQGLRGLLAECVATKLQAACLNHSNLSADWVAQVKKVTDRIAQSNLPLRHWRMVGPVGRGAGWVRSYPEFLGALDGGSEVFLRRKPVFAGKNRALIVKLLAEPGVVAVVRQRQGQSLLVVRYLEQDTLVLDYFEYPKEEGGALGLFALLDNANVAWYIKQLRPPQHPRTWSVKGKHQQGWGWNLEALFRVDRGQEVLSYLGVQPYDLKREQWRHPMALAGHGWMHTQHSKQAWKWVLDLEGVDPSAYARPKDLSRQQWSWPRFVPADRRKDFPLRATQWGQAWIYAITSLPAVAQAAARGQTGTYEAEDHDFVYRWYENELPKAILGANQAQNFFDKVRRYPGQWRWSSAKEGRAAQLELNVELGAKRAAGR